MQFPNQDKVDATVVTNVIEAGFTEDRNLIVTGRLALESAAMVSFKFFQVLMKYKAECNQQISDGLCH